MSTPVIFLSQASELAQLANGKFVDRIDSSAETSPFLEFFAVGLRNANTRQAYFRAVERFLMWVSATGLTLQTVRPVHVAAWVEIRSSEASVATVKQELAALRMLFNWLVVGQVLPVNPATSVKSPRHSVRKGKTPVLSADEARVLVESIDVSNIAGLRDRALIGLMIFTFARIGAALSMTVDDVYTQHRRLWVRLHEKGGKLHHMPCHHQLEEWLDAYVAAAGIADDPSGFLFRSLDRSRARLTSIPLHHVNAYMMVKRRARAAGIKTEISNHTFRATGITAYLSSGGTLEQAARMANHASTRTTQLYDRREDAVTLSEVEKISI